MRKTQVNEMVLNLKLLLWNSNHGTPCQLSFPDSFLTTQTILNTGASIISLLVTVGQLPISLGIKINLQVAMRSFTICFPTPSFNLSDLRPNTIPFSHYPPITKFFAVLKHSAFAFAVPLPGTLLSRYPYSLLLLHLQIFAQISLAL